MAQKEPNKVPGNKEVPSTQEGEKEELRKLANLLFDCWKEEINGNK